MEWKMLHWKILNLVSPKAKNSVFIVAEDKISALCSHRRHIFTCAFCFRSWCRNIAKYLIRVPIVIIHQLHTSTLGCNFSFSFLIFKLSPEILFLFCLVQIRSDSEPIKSRWMEKCEMNIRVLIYFSSGHFLFLHIQWT